MEAAHRLTDEERHVDLRAAFGTLDGAPAECRDFFTQDNDGGTFGHGGIASAGAIPISTEAWPEGAMG
jgi:hypothetical protein